MKSRKFTRSTVQLNTLTPTAVDPVMVINQTAKGVFSQDYILYPKGFLIVNGTAADLEFLIISNESELEEYNAGLPYYDYLLIPAGARMENSNLPRAYKFYIRSVGGAGATNGLRIDFMQYT